jgi:hypothetical protein
VTWDVVIAGVAAVALDDEQDSSDSASSGVEDEVVTIEDSAAVLMPVKLVKLGVCDLATFGIVVVVVGSVMIGVWAIGLALKRNNKCYFFLNLNYFRGGFAKMHICLRKKLIWIHLLILGKFRINEYRKDPILRLMGKLY